MQYLKNKKTKVLVCAFACAMDPDRRFGSGKGGEGILGKNIVIQLDRFFDVFVLTHISNKESIEKEKAFSNIKFYYVDLPSFLNFTKKWIQIYAYLWQIKAYFVAEKLHRENKFDVFHHVTYANDWMASYIGALLPIPYIRGPGGGAHRVPKKFVNEYSFKNSLAEKIRSAGQWIFRHDLFYIIGQDRARAILTCNKEAFNVLPRKLQERAYFFPVNGISKNDFLMLENYKELFSENNNSNFLILTAGKLIKIKGFDLAIKAFKIFGEKESNSKLVIVGEGPELENLKKLANDLNMGNRVVFERWMPREKLFEKFLQCSIFLFPSLRDGGGNVVVEAMAAGKPVVCFDLAGPGFHVDEKCGIKIKAVNPSQAVRDMAYALEKLFYDKDLRDKLSEGAKEKAEKEYDWNKLGDKLFRIYEKVL